MFRSARLQPSRAPPAPPTLAPRHIRRARAEPSDEFIKRRNRKTLITTAPKPIGPATVPNGTKCMVAEGCGGKAQWGVVRGNVCHVIDLDVDELYVMEKPDFKIIVEVADEPVVKCPASGISIRTSCDNGANVMNAPDTQDLFGDDNTEEMYFRSEDSAGQDTYLNEPDAYNARVLDVVPRIV